MEEKESLMKSLYEIEDSKTEVLASYEEKRMNLQSRIRKHEEEISKLGFFQFRKKRELKERIKELQERLRYEERLMEERVRDIRRKTEELQDKLKEFE